jgi:hypothetical protein
MLCLLCRVWYVLVDLKEIIWHHKLAAAAASIKLRASAPASANAKLMVDIGFSFLACTIRLSRTLTFHPLLIDHFFFWTFAVSVVRCDTFVVSYTRFLCYVM